jgi:hypothetical protein
MTKVLNWGMTYGMGDAMMALNCAYRWSEEEAHKLQLNLHWFHNKDHLHHCEETETIIERTDYINGLYLKSNVEVNHIINSDQTQFKRSGNGKFDWFKPRKNRYTNNWTFDPSVFLPTDEKKVVLWRPLYNAQVPRLWKRSVTNDNWDLVIYKLKEMGYNVVELCYRTPIREATYHISTCNFVVCYDGMWHYIAKNFWKPMIVSTLDEITRYHTRHALPIADYKFVDYVCNIHTPKMKNHGEIISPYDFMQYRTNNKKNEFWNWYNGNR